MLKGIKEANLGVFIFVYQYWKCKGSKSLNFQFFIMWIDEPSNFNVVNRGLLVAFKSYIS